MRDASRGSPLIRILVADDNQPVRHAIACFLQYDPEIHVVAETETLRQTIDHLENFKPDLILLELRLCEQVETRRAKEYFSGCRLLGMSLWVDETTRARA